MKLILATHNRDKIREIRDILAGLDVEVVSVDDVGGVPEPEEDGATLEANALKKAREIRDATGISALADDTGLEVDALGGAPGVYSARYAGESGDYAANCEKLVRDMAAVSRPQRTARFRTVMALALNDDDASRLSGPAIDVLIAEGILPGEIAAAPRGAGGFGYDPLFVDTESGRTLAEMSAGEKNAISHRYRALVEVRELMMRTGLLHEVSSGSE